MTKSRYTKIDTRYYKRLRYSVLLLIFISSCSLFYSSIADNIKVVSIKKVTASNVLLNLLSNNIEMEFIVEVKNDNPLDINLISSEFDVYSNDILLGKGKSNKHQELKKNSVNDLEFLINVKPSKVIINGLDFAAVLLKKEPLEFYVDGNFKAEADLSIVKIPVKIKQKIKVDIK